jgi:hypothetical protein
MGTQLTGSIIYTLVTIIPAHHDDDERRLSRTGKMATTCVPEATSKGDEWSEDRGRRHNAEFG